MSDTLNTLTEMNWPEEDWTMPVIDIHPEETKNSEKPALPQVDLGATGAWTAFAIGAVTKQLNKERDEGSFPRINSKEHPAHLTKVSSESE